MICTIVLAAGRSQRMGTQKLLLPWGCKTVIAHVVDEFLRSPIQEVFVVVGKDAAGIKEALGDRPIKFIPNPDAQGDMLSSVRCGLRALPKECEAVLVAVGDQPTVTADLVIELVRVFHGDHLGIVVPVHQGRHGHPILISARFVEEVLNRHEGIGLRGLLHAHKEEVFELPFSTSTVLEDMDTPEDYERQRMQASLPKESLR